MEDYILREIDKIGQLLRALLEKAGLRRKQNTESAEESRMVKADMLEKLGIDIDTLLSDEDFVSRLIAEHNFSEEHLDQFAELLFDMTASSDIKEDRIRFAWAIGSIYRYLDEHKAPSSINRYYILKDLKQYTE